MSPVRAITYHTWFNQSGNWEEAEQQVEDEEEEKKGCGGKEKGNKATNEDKMVLNLGEKLKTEHFWGKITSSQTAVSEYHGFAVAFYFVRITTYQGFHFSW